MLRKAEPEEPIEEPAEPTERERLEDLQTFTERWIAIFELREIEAMKTTNKKPGKQMPG